MKRLFAAVAALTMLAPGALAAPRLTPEAELARALEGRVAGEPVDCINLRNVRSSRIINDTAIIYDVGRTLYVNRPRGGAQSLNSWDILVTKTFSDRLCSIDTITLYDASSRIPGGIVFLGDFVPYRKVAAR